MRTRRSWRNQDRLYKSLGQDLAKAASGQAPPPTDESLYAAVVRLGIEHDSHESDLYLPATDQVRELLTLYGIDPFSPSASQFRHQVTGAIWFDVCFRYDPWWAARAARKR